MSLRPPRAKPTHAPHRQNELSTVLLAGIFDRAISIDAKRKVDGEAANSRYGGEEAASAHWLNERWRQTMLLIRQFRYNWNEGAMLSDDDVQYLRICLDVALDQAARQGHKGDQYDVNPTLWAIWLVQHVHAVRAGGWTVERFSDKLLWMTAGMYTFLQAMHTRGDVFIVRDPTTRVVLHRYNRLPFRAMRVPPRDDKVFVWRKAARRLSDWMADGGLAPMDEAIINQQLPTVVPPLPAAAAREARRDALWRRVAQRANQRPLRSVRGDDADAQETRRLVSGVMDESRAAAGSEGGGGLSDEQADALEADLEREMMEATAQPEAEGGPSAEPEGQPPPPRSQQQGSDEPIPVTAERIGPPSGELFHINELLEEIQGL